MFWVRLARPHLMNRIMRQLRLRLKWYLPQLNFYVTTQSTCIVTDSLVINLFMPFWLRRWRQVVHHKSFNRSFINGRTSSIMPRISEINLFSSLIWTILGGVLDTISLAAVFATTLMSSLSCPHI